MKTASQILKRIVILTLVVTATAKIVSAFGSSPIVDRPDGVLGIPNKWLFLCVASIEIAIAGYLSIGKRVLTQSNLLLWLGTGFGVYRISKWWFKVPEPCSCLGSFTDWFPALERFVDPLMILSLASIILCSITLRIQHHRDRSKTI
ncbi:hypothetical protein OAH36_00390 [Verrucomicrobia bacterium]|jgi:hypothetical protein|nr:hypothetical protein [bacterium]MDB4798034.1 hypothetical protein [Verrucomicrobiota bacterium]